MGCFSKCHSLPERGWVMTSGDVTAQSSVSKIPFPVPKSTLASQWETQQSSGGFQTCPALQAPKLCIYSIIYFSFHCLVKRFARTPSAHLRVWNPRNWFCTEGEVVDGAFGNRSRTWAQIKPQTLKKTATKTNLFLELIFKIPLMELQKPRQFSSSLLRVWPAPKGACSKSSPLQLVFFGMCCLTGFWDLLSHRVQANPQHI